MEPLKSKVRGTLWQHEKTGRIYQVLYQAMIEADMTLAIVYVSLEDKRVWVRPWAEFMDGRFKRVDAVAQ